MIYRFDTYELDVQRGELRASGHRVAIEPKVFDVLVYLLQHRGRVVTKAELLEHCWAETWVSEAALTRCLAKVRKAVEPGPAGSPVVQTIYGRGYCFVAPVTLESEAPSLPWRPAPHVPTPDVPGPAKILIVDDEPWNVDYLEQMLAELNPVVRGWGMYYRRAHVRRLFNRLNGWIVLRVWNFRYRRWYWRSRTLDRPAHEK